MKILLKPILKLIVLFLFQTNSIKFLILNASEKNLEKKKQLKKKYKKYSE